MRVRSYDLDFSSNRLEVLTNTQPSQQTNPETIESKPCPEGLLFLEWIAARAEAEFLLKTDDDDAWQGQGSAGSVGQKKQSPATGNKTKL